MTACDKTEFPGEGVKIDEEVVPLDDTAEDKEKEVQIDDAAEDKEKVVLLDDAAAEDKDQVGTFLVY